MRQRNKLPDYQSWRTLCVYVSSEAPCGLAVWIMAATSGLSRCGVCHWTATALRHKEMITFFVELNWYFILSRRKIIYWKIHQRARTFVMCWTCEHTGRLNTSAFNWITLIVLTDKWSFNKHTPLHEFSNVYATCYNCDNSRANTRILLRSAERQWLYLLSGWAMIRYAFAA